MSDPSEATHANPHPVSGHRTPHEIAEDEAGPIGQPDADVVAGETINGLVVRPEIAEDQPKRFSGSDDGPTKVVDLAPGLRKQRTVNQGQKDPTGA